MSYTTQRGLSLLPLLPHHQQQMMRFRASKFRLPVIILLLASITAPLLFLSRRPSYFSPLPGNTDFLDSSISISEEHRKIQTFSKIEGFFQNEEDSPLLGVDLKSRKGIQSSWVVEKPIDATSDIVQGEADDKKQDRWQTDLDLGISIRGREALDLHDEEATERDILHLGQNTSNDDVNKDVSETATRQQIRMERRERRVSELIQQNSEADINIEKGETDRRKDLDNRIHTKYSIWRKENEEPDSLVRLIRDQLVMARVYASLANAQDDADLLHELNTRIKESRRIMGEANVDSDLPRSAPEKANAMGQLLTKAREHLYDCKLITKKLRAMLQGSEDQTRILYKQSAVLRQLVAKTIPKGLHCLSMLLISEYNSLPKFQRSFPGQENLEDTNLFHYALFSDNVIATSVVVNSTIVNAKDPDKHVFHIVTDKLNYPAMRMWFLANPPGNATIEVQNIDDFKWLNASYCPVLRQLQSVSMKEYYFKSDQPATLDDASSNLKYRNPKYLSILNHLRFYLPEVYPKLDKILFLDDDIVVQQDLTKLWSIDLNGNVNGAVETCGENFHRFDKYLNFSNSLISENFSPNACGWAYGMNIFDLRQWRMHDITGIYHKWQSLNEDRNLWKLGTLPPGLITFYNLTYPLDKRWHVLGLGYDAHIETEDIDNAAVVHYNGNMKPWLELAMVQYKPYWMKYLDHNHQFLQHCNIHF